MKHAFVLLTSALGWLAPFSMLAQEPVSEPKMSVEARMAKARAAKAHKRAIAPVKGTANSSQTRLGSQRATPADYQTPVDKLQKGPNGEAVHVGERGGKFYINKNGQKTYLSSNQ